MQKLNELFWAFVIAVTIAGVLSVIGFLFTRPEIATQEIFRIANDLVTGALGFFAGRASAALIKTQGGDAKNGDATE